MARRPRARFAGGFIRFPSPVHRFPTRSKLIQLRLAALLLLLFALSVVLMPVAVVWGTLLGEPRALQASFVLIPTTVLSGILFLFMSAGVRCPLCRGEVLRALHRGSANAKASRLLGSHRLRVIWGIFFSGSYRCLHCGEPCETRNPRR